MKAKDKEIQIKVVPHSQQRYNTVGDYQTDENGVTHITISDLGDWRKNLLIMVHELVESEYCKAEGISEEEIDRFDMEFEAKRKPGDHSDPGDDPSAPYYHQHQLAIRVEYFIMNKLGMDSEEHEGKIDQLTDSYPD